VLALVVWLPVPGGTAAAQEHGAVAPPAREAPAPADAHQATPADVPHGQPPAGAHAEEEAGHGEESGHGESLGAFLSRIANFLILALGLWYFARSPLGNYLAAKAERIRDDLAHAERTRKEAEARLAAIEQQMRALPDELEGLRSRGSEEIAVEYARIRELATHERERLLEHTRREIDAQLRSARRDLARHAAELAVDLASARIKSRITAEDHARLIDRYVTQVKAAHD
jgi:F-type H+-transporting ATPase subunit b